MNSHDAFKKLTALFIHFWQVGENEPFVSELLTTLRTTIADLEPHQIHSFYESVGPLYIVHNVCSVNYL